MVITFETYATISLKKNYTTKPSKGIFKTKHAQFFSACYEESLTNLNSHFQYMYRFEAEMLCF